VAGGFLEQKKIIDAAIKAGVKKFLPLEFSTNTLSDTVQQLVPVFNGNKDVIDYLKSKEDGAMTWTAIACGLLFDWVCKLCVRILGLTHC
jgi:NmrA-like family